MGGWTAVWPHALPVCWAGLQGGAKYRQKRRLVENSSIRGKCPSFILLSGLGAVIRDWDSPKALKDWITAGRTGGAPQSHGPPTGCCTVSRQVPGSRASPRPLHFCKGNEDAVRLT